MHYKLIRKDNRMSDSPSKETLLEIIKREFGVNEAGDFCQWEPIFDDKSMAAFYIADNEVFSVMCYR